MKKKHPKPLTREQIKDRAAKRWRRQPECSPGVNAFYEEMKSLHEGAYLAGYRAGRKAGRKEAKK